MKLESKIQSDIIKWLKKGKDTVTYKHPPYPSGIPDIAHYEKGVAYFFEVKRTESDEARELQAYRIKQFKRAGISATVVRSVEEVMRIVKRKV